MRRSVRLPGLLALLTTAGCYSYQTIRLEDVRPDLPIRLRVTPEATGHVATVMGYLTQDLQGTFVSLQDDTVLMTVVTPTAPESRTIQHLYQRLDLPVSQIIEVQRRSFNRGGTYACVGVAAAGAAAITVWAFSGVLGGSGGETGPPPANNRPAPGGFLLPLVRLPLGR